MSEPSQPRSLQAPGPIHPGGRSSPRSGEDDARGTRRGRLWRWFRGPEPWTSGQVVSEILVVPVVTVLVLVIQLIASGSMEWTLGSVALTLALCVLRRPLPGLSLLTVVAVASFLPGVGALLPLVGWSVGRRVAEPWRALTFLGVAFLVDLAASVHGSFLTEDGTRSVMGVVATSLWFLSLVTIPGLVARYLNQRRTLLAAVRAQHHQLIRENSIIARETRMRERQRIARDMHDSLGHHLTLIAVHTGALQVDPGLSGPQREAVGVLREASVVAMRELREVVGILKDEDGEEAGGPDRSAHGVREVPELVASTGRAGTAVTHTVTGTPRGLEPAADQAAYRVVQEGLTNAHKHAPGSSVTVALRYEPDVLLVEVVNGARSSTTSEPEGHDTDAVVSGGRGLDGLGERARAAGGMLHSGPYGDGGFRLAVALPYDVATVADPGHQRAVRDLDRVVGGRSRGCLPIALTIGGLLAALVVTGVGWLIVDVERSLVSPEEYQRARVGQDERELREELPQGSSLASTLDAEYARPKGARCLVMFSSAPLNADGTGDLARFCFRDGKLIGKHAFD